MPGEVKEKSDSKVEDDLGAKELETGGVYEGLPYKGRPVIIKESDPDWKKPQHTFEGHAAVFNMGKDEDAKAYGRLMDRMVKGFIVPGQRRIVYDREEKTYILFMEWADQYYTSPPFKEEKPPDSRRKENRE